MGLTNSVHPYCRLAIATMHRMPTHSCMTRYPMDAWPAFAVAPLLMSSPLPSKMGFPASRSDPVQVASHSSAQPHCVRLGNSWKFRLFRSDLALPSWDGSNHRVVCQHQ